MNYWYIWFEVLENGKTRGKGQYPRAYKHKSSAVRRAKQMWNEPLHNPMTGTFVERIWVVSQTNPWDERYIFVSRAEAESFVRSLKQLCDWYGYASVVDAKDIADKEIHDFDYHYGWMKDGVNQAKVLPTTCGYVIDMPKAIPLI